MEANMKKKHNSASAGIGVLQWVYNITKFRTDQQNLDKGKSLLCQCIMEQ